MILTGNEDLRVIKTIEAIKGAFEALICEKDYDKITVRELCDRAKINKRPFITTTKRSTLCLPKCRRSCRRGIWSA